MGRIEESYCVLGNDLDLVNSPAGYLFKALLRDINRVFACDFVNGPGVVFSALVNRVSGATLATGFDFTGLSSFTTAKINKTEVQKISQLSPIASQFISRAYVYTYGMFPIL